MQDFLRGGEALNRGRPSGDPDQMRRIAAIVASLALGVPALAGPPAHAQPSGGVRAPGGEPRLREPRPRVDRARPRVDRPRVDRGAPVVTLLSAGPELFHFGGSTLIRYRIDDQAPRVEVRLYIRRVEYPDQRLAIELGRRTTGAVHAYRWRNAHELEGASEIKVWARDPAGNRVARGSRNQGAVRVRYLAHVFPLLGAYDLGGEGSRFGAPRRGHSHQGHDILAAEGTPVLAVRAGRIGWRRYQAEGAGHYLVLDADGEDRDYVYMHLREGSTLVEEGDRVKTGQLLAGVGSTGASSGPHLHFEIWRGAWFDGGSPIDPLPELERWLRLAGSPARDGAQPPPTGPAAPPGPTGGQAPTGPAAPPGPTGGQGGAPATL